MNRKSTVSELMTKNVIVASLESKLETVLEFFHVYKVHHLPVTSDNVLLGILSITDVFDFMAFEFSKGRAATFDDLKNHFNIKDVMTKNPITVHEDDPIEAVIKILAAASFQSVLVVNGDDLVGIVTNNDLVKFLGQL